MVRSLHVESTCRKGRYWTLDWSWCCAISVWELVWMVEAIFHVYFWPSHGALICVSSPVQPCWAKLSSRWTSSRVDSKWVRPVSKWVILANHSQPITAPSPSETRVFWDSTFVIAGDQRKRFFKTSLCVQVLCSSKINLFGLKITLASLSDLLYFGLHYWVVLSFYWWKTNISWFWCFVIKAFGKQNSKRPLSENDLRLVLN